MKKYFEKFKNLKNTNKKLYYATICLFVLTGFTFAYVIDQISGGAISKVFITADTSDNLQFEVDKDILIKPTQFNFEQGGEDLFDIVTATARLKANSTNNTAKYTYNVYFEITTNEYIYTTEDHKPEMILQVTNPNGEDLTELDGLTYNEALQGFDITTEKGLIPIVEEYEIISNSSTSFTEQNWIIKVSFVNLDSNQVDNEGKTLEGKILIQKNRVGDIKVAVTNLPTTYGSLAKFSCTNTESIYNSKYDRIEVTNFSNRISFCNLDYMEVGEKTYLNNYVIGLEGIEQDGGMVYHEVFTEGDYKNTQYLLESEYDSLSIYNSKNETIENVFNFIDNKWIVNTSNTESKETYHFDFNINDSGYYQFCYELPDIYSGIKVKKGNYESSFHGREYNTDSGENCMILGYLSSNTELKVSYSKYEQSVGNANFSLKKALTSTSYDTGYRYEGMNPNNYVWFNNELWRIIGVFDEKIHGQSNQKLVKIIKVNSIGSFAWNNDNFAMWKDADLNRLLNDAYYYQKDGSNNEYCLNSYCDFRTSGIKDKYRKMIREVYWKSGIIQSVYSDSNMVYIYDTDDKYKNTGYIGLINASDHFYASTNICGRNITIGYYAAHGVCDGSNWIYRDDGTNTTTSYEMTSYYQTIIYTTDRTSTKGSYKMALESTRPALYLDSNVYLISGTGMIDDPYIIGF